MYNSLEKKNQRNERRFKIYKLLPNWKGWHFWWWVSFESLCIKLKWDKEARKERLVKERDLKEIFKVRRGKEWEGEWESFLGCAQLALCCVPPKRKKSQGRNICSKSYFFSFFLLSLFPLFLLCFVLSIFIDFWSFTKERIPKKRRSLQIRCQTISVVRGIYIYLQSKASLLGVQKGKEKGKLGRWFLCCLYH